MTDALTLRDLSKTYKNGFQALKGIDLTVPEGEFYALLGPNGAGKSTTIGIISSLTKKTSGTVEIFGHNLDTHPSQAKQCLGVVPQEFNFAQFEKTFDILVTQAGYYGIPKKIAEVRAEEYLEKLGLWEKRGVQARMLSGGMKRRLMIARAMMHQPRLLILDEPTSSIDAEAEAKIFEKLEVLPKDRTVILISHRFSTVRQASRIVVIEKGKIKELGTHEELLKLDGIYARLFKLQAKGYR